MPPFLGGLWLASKKSLCVFRYIYYIYILDSYIDVVNTTKTLTVSLDFRACLCYRKRKVRERSRKMRLREWLGYNLYKKLWSLVGGRPWTYIMRDFYQTFEFFIIMGFFSLGYFLRPYLNVREFMILVISGTIFFILGHVLWGTKHIPGQEGR